MDIKVSKYTYKSINMFKVQNKLHFIRDIYKYYWNGFIVVKNVSNKQLDQLDTVDHGIFHLLNFFLFLII